MNQICALTTAWRANKDSSIYFEFVENGRWWNQPDKPNAAFQWIENNFVEIGAAGFGCANNIVQVNNLGWASQGASKVPYGAAIVYGSACLIGIVEGTTLTGGYP